MIPLSGPARSIVDHILSYAVDSGASDIHIEPADESVRIRLRRDGVLCSMGELPSSKLDTLTARIKIMASLDIANKRLPQDGRIAWKEGKHMIDMRVSTMPTIRGEKTVIRLLDAGRVSLDLDALGIADAAIALIRQAIHMTRGLFIMSGVTGSGKTTTLYAALKELDHAALNLVTLEDPVEYHIDGINQSQINAKCGLEFQNGLRALLRQDPDVIVIGEIRDRETARIAIQAALTGHKIFATLHTATASDVPIRLIDMGIEAYLVADALIGMTSQRLARKLCPACCKAMGNLREPYIHIGCDCCLHSGYSGRVCLCEVVPVGPEIRQAIRRGYDENQFTEAARADGAFFMQQGIDWALQQGLTDQQEVNRIYDMGGEYGHS
ncbi:MAG: GspE/PulE family protein [Megasphaera sp.]|jgi:type II secretory ATPase GspE/PulE/Tfp pilus assembly ATPase PilB-like protein|nr:GspE/PulE family protein [Megasphaera sp.]MCI1248126.1 GspE/PulE family protein [Megasphaera sp.]